MRASGKGSQPSPHEPIERLDVDLERRRGEKVSARSAYEQARPEELAQPRHLRLEGSQRVDRDGVDPELLDETAGHDHAPGVKSEKGEQGSLAPAGRGARLAP